MNFIQNKSKIRNVKIFVKGIFKNIHKATSTVSLYFWYCWTSPKNNLSYLYIYAYKHLHAYCIIMLYYSFRLRLFVQTILFSLQKFSCNCLSRQSSRWIWVESLTGTTGLHPPLTVTWGQRQINMFAEGQCLFQLYTEVFVG